MVAWPFATAFAALETEEQRSTIPPAIRRRCGSSSMTRTDFLPRVFRAEPLIVGNARMR